MVTMSSRREVVMPEYSTKSRQLTPRTTVHDVVLDGKVIATCGKPEAAAAISDAFTKHRVLTLKSFKELPFKLQMSFVMATSMAQPNFH